MSDFLRRVGARVSAPARTRVEEAPPRLRHLLRDILIEDHGPVGGYRVLAEADGQNSSDVWGADYAANRLQELVEDVDWVVVYEMLESYAPKPLSGLDSLDDQVNAVLAREGIAYEMRDGEFGPFDPEAEELDLDLSNPLDDAGDEFLPVRRQYQRAVDALSAMPTDALTAVRESANAMEALARVLYSRPTATFSDLIINLVGGSNHRKALANSMKALYGYASTLPGARHGEHETVEVGYPEAAFVVRSAGAAIAMLLAENRD